MVLNLREKRPQNFRDPCLERSGEAPLTVYLDLKHGDWQKNYPDCTCILSEWSSRRYFNEDHPCRYHTTIEPLRGDDSAQRICKLDVCLNMLNTSKEEPDEEFKNALDDFKFFVLPLPSLESLSFSINHEPEIDTHLNYPRGLFS